MRDPFPPIESYAFLSDGRAMALVAPSGSVEWLCLPRPDAASVFGAILDRDAGRCTFGPHDPAELRARRYMPGTLVVESVWQTPSGIVETRDALVVDDRLDALGRLTRLARCTEGSVGVAAACEPRSDYGRVAATWSVEASRDGVTSALTGNAEDETRLVVTSDLALNVQDGRLVGHRSLSAGEDCFIDLGWAPGSGPTTAGDAAAVMEVTASAWRGWLGAAAIAEDRWRPLIERSALTLKGLIFAPTGAPLAAATASLPEHLGGTRNWDYRYTWLRDGVFTLAALQDLGFRDEARAFIRFVVDQLADGRELLIMYGVGGERELPEATLDHLSGYRGSRPVRIGNAAITQRQHDVWGALLHLAWREAEATGSVDDATWELVEPQVEATRRHWREPDRGVWEVRGEPRHFTSSKVMCWVAFDRAARLARLRGRDDLAAAWRTDADAVRADVLAHGVDRRGALTQAYGSDALDASCLLAVLLGLLDPRDPPARATTLAIADELTDDGLVLRYRTETTDDGQAGEEGSFTICSFWLVSALARIGETDRARALMERLVGYASPLGLYAEEIDPRTGSHLGNMPQAFSHLALIGAALDLGVAGAGRSSA